MATALTYIKEWQQALQSEISYLKKYGNNKFLVFNGKLIAKDVTYTYYFDTAIPINVPTGATVRLEWENIKQNGRVLSSEGKSVILTLDKSIGDLIHEACLYHDLWELLEQLIQRFDEIKKSKRKRARIKKLMDPSMPAKHPRDKVKNSLHEIILRSKYNPVTYIWGPPGTGKTYILARVAANKYFKEKQVLILSQSNQAVDVLLNELVSFIQKKERFREGDVLRYGSNYSEVLNDLGAITTVQLIRKQNPELAEKEELLLEERRKLKLELSGSFSKRDSDNLLDLETKIARVQEKIRQKEIQYLKDAAVIGATLAKAASDPGIYEKEFDVVILDEASMAYVPQVAFAATLGKRIIICGDFKQLPPIASSRDSLVTKWLKEDIFHRVGIADLIRNGGLHPQLFLLKEQRRMHPEISSFTNRYIYHSLVEDHQSVLYSRNKITARSPFPKRASILIDTSYMGGRCIAEKMSHSRINLWQLFLSFQLIHEALIGGARSIGYVTPYRAQADLMNLILEDLYEQEQVTTNIIAATVHKFQGSERDVLIFDTVDSAPQDRAGMLLIGRNSERLINVALTRTRGKFLNVSDVSFIRNHVFPGKTLRQLVEHQERHGQAIKAGAIGSWIRNQHRRLRWIHALKLDSVFRDMDSARTSISVSLPACTVLPEIWKNKLKNRSSMVKLTIFSGESWGELNPDHLLKENLPFPFVVIDQHIFWLGLPLEGAVDIRPPYVAARLNSEKFTVQFLRQFYYDE